MNRGKLVIVLILGVALVAAGFSTWYRYRGQHRAHDFWGTKTALLIAEAPQVKVFQLGDPAPTSEDAAGPEEAAAPLQADDAEPPPPSAVEFRGNEWQVAAVHDATAARGINNVRTALVLDMTYDWKEVPHAGEPDWQYALAVNDGKHWATLLFDFDTRQVALAGGKKTMQLDPAASGDFQQFFAELFPAAESGDKPATKPDAEPAAKPDAEPTGAAAETK